MYPLFMDEYVKRFQRYGIRITYPDVGDDEEYFMGRVKYLESLLREFADKWVFQLERGDKEGHLHFQGRFSFPRGCKRAPIPTSKLFSDGGHPVHLTIESGTGESKHTYYCLKSETRVAGPWTDQKSKQYIPKRFRDVELLPWQSDLLSKAHAMTEREVTVLWDPAGSKGKSTLTDWCEHQAGAFQISPSLSTPKEIMQTVMNEYEDRMRYDPTCQENRQLIFIDLCRASDQGTFGKSWSSWCSTVEELAKGRLYDTRYRYRKFWVEPPYIVIMCNQLPSLTDLTANRWKIYTFGEEDTLVLNDTNGIRLSQNMERMRRKNEEKSDINTLLKLLKK